MSTLAWGIVGAGWMARRFAITLNALPGMAIAAVSSQRPERAEAFRAEHQAGRAYVDHEALIADPGVDVVYVATPNHLHHDITLAALRAGKPVLCEKPLAMTAAEGRAIAATAAERRVFCMEAMWTRFLPVYRSLGTLTAEAGLGRPVALRSAFGVPMPYEPEGRFYNPAHGGGSLLDLGVYGVSIAVQLLGEPASVDGVASLGATGVDEQCFITLRYPQAMASLESSFRSPLGNDLEVFCENGGFRISPLFIQSDSIEIWNLSTDAPPRIPPREGMSFGAHTEQRRGLVSRLLKRPREEAPEPRAVLRIGFETHPNRHAHQALEVMNCLREGRTESPLMPLSESVAVLDVLDRVRACWQPHRAVEPEPGAA